VSVFAQEASPPSLATTRGCTFCAVEGFTNPETDRELEELRARAYGPHPDIDLDPVALARLRELEAAHRPHAERRADDSTSDNASAAAAGPTLSATGSAAARRSQPAQTSTLRSLMQRSTATWWGLLAWAGGALVVATAIIAAVLLVSAPRPVDALPPAASVTLHRTPAEVDQEVQRMVDESAPWFAIDTSTLRAYGSYLGLEIWSGVNAYDSPCLLAVHRVNKNLAEARCAPAAADLILDIESSGDGFDGFEGLDGEGIIRFIQREDTVEGDVYLMPEAD
jgi:hypothetical protein